MSVPFNTVKCGGVNNKRKFVDCGIDDDETRQDTTLYESLYGEFSGDVSIAGFDDELPFVLHSPVDSMCVEQKVIPAQTSNKTQREIEWNMNPFYSEYNEIVKQGYPHPSFEDGFPYSFPVYEHSSGNISSTTRGVQLVWRAPLTFARSLWKIKRDFVPLPRLHQFLNLTGISHDSYIESVLFGRLLQWFSQHEFKFIQNDKIRKSAPRSGSVPTSRDSSSFTASLLYTKDGVSLFSAFVVDKDKPKSLRHIFQTMCSSYVWGLELTELLAGHVLDCHVFSVHEHGVYIKSLVRQMNCFNITGLFQTNSALKRSIREKLDQNGSLVDLKEYLSNLNISSIDFGVYTSVIQQRRTNQQTKVYNFTSDSILRFVQALIASTHWLDKVLLVQLACGSRFVEVLTVSDYYTSDCIPEPLRLAQTSMSYFGVPEQLITVYGVAKSRTDTVTMDEVSQSVVSHPQDDENDQDDIEIDHLLLCKTLLPPKPVLFITPRQLTHLVYTVIRPKIKEFYYGDLKNLKQLTIKFNPSANSRLSEFTLSDDERPITTHMLRKIYANYSFDTQGLQTSLTRTAWITRVLGHAPQSFTTALSYNNAVMGRTVVQPDVISLVDQTVSPPCDDDTMTVKLYTKKGKHEVVMSRIPHKSKLTDKLPLFKTYSDHMRTACVSLSYRNFRKLGFSNSFIKKMKLSE